MSIFIVWKKLTKIVNSLKKEEIVIVSNDKALYLVTKLVLLIKKLDK